MAKVEPEDDKELWPPPWSFRTVFDGFR
jgi:hypothetical protein